jgi:dihydrolipoamide dehydrogenase
MKKMKIAVIGGGPGGYVAAIRCHQYDMDVALFEKEKLGGVCLNWGCIPTKSLVKVADLYHEIKNCDSFGISVDSSKLNYEDVWKRKNAIVEQLGKGINHLFSKRKIPIYSQTVKSIKKENNHYLIDTGEEQFSAEYVILATGSAPKELPNLKIDGRNVLSSTEMLDIKNLPAHLVVVGGGVIGCEFASIYAQMGVSVEIVEFLPSLLYTEDEEISKRLAMAMKKAKIKVHLKTAVESYEEKNDKLIVHLSNNKTIETEKILLSVGRKPVFNIDTEGFDLAKEKGFIEINDECRTNEKNIFAIGDVTGKMMLAHVASKQGLVVVEVLKKEMTDQKSKHFNLNYSNVPRCTFTNPEIASVGLTTVQAKETYDDILIGKSTFMANGKALGLGNTFGFVKIIAALETGEIVGVHIIGPQATELIAQCSILVSLKVTIHNADKIVFAHPTLSEAIMEALEDLENIAIHSV